MRKLCKSYRSTFEITDFAQKIHPNAELEPVARHGEKPQILQFGSAVEELSGIMGLCDGGEITEKQPVLDQERKRTCGSEYHIGF